jgi:hypothetical protein
MAEAMKEPADEDLGLGVRLTLTLHPEQRCVI